MLLSLQSEELPIWCTASCARTRSRRAHWALLAKTSAVSLACIHRLELCLLSRRNEVSVLFQILDYFFADHLALESAQGTLDRFIAVYSYKCHLFSHLLSAVIGPKGQTIIRLSFPSKRKPDPEEFARQCGVFRSWGLSLNLRHFGLKARRSVLLPALEKIP